MPHAINNSHLLSWLKFNVLDEAPSLCQLARFPSPSSAPHVAFRANVCQRETWDLFWSLPARCAVWAKAGQGQDQKAGAAGRNWRGLGGSWKYMVRWLPLAVIFDYAVSVPFRSSFFAYVIFSAFSLDSTTHASQGLCCKMKRVHFNMWVKPLISSQLGNKCKCGHRVLGIECWILENAVGIFDFLLETLQFLWEFWSLCDENLRVNFKNLKPNKLNAIIIFMFILYLRIFPTL